MEKRNVHPVEPKRSSRQLEEEHEKQLQIAESGGTEPSSFLVISADIDAPVSTIATVMATGSVVDYTYAPYEGKGTGETSLSTPTETVVGTINISL